LFIIIAILYPLTLLAQEYPTKDWQISTAIMAVPELEHENATVIGCEKGRELTGIRQGANDLICLADDPSGKRFSIACYHESLEPFMSRGRELKKQGKSSEEIFNIREEEAKAGTLEMPKHALLNVLIGQVNEATKQVEKTHLRYVYYIPFATFESTGLPLALISPGAP
jgi:hypothetical protein